MWQLSGVDRERGGPAEGTSLLGLRRLSRGRAPPETRRGARGSFQNQPLSGVWLALCLASLYLRLSG